MQVYIVLFHDAGIYFYPLVCMCILDMTQVFLVILLGFKEVSFLNSSLGTHLGSSH